MCNRNLSTKQKEKENEINNILTTKFYLVIFVNIYVLANTRT